MPFSLSRSVSLIAKSMLLALATSVLFTAGCGMGTAAPAQNASIAGVGGIVHGGPNAITSATVNLYATATAAYGTSSTLLATTTTDGNGSFTFTSPATCPSDQQAYVTIVGGQTGGNANNPQVLLMAALGPCTGISASTVIYISEVTTVAAGYALSNFMGISGTTVNVSAPATNNAATASCSGTGSSMTCSASGLAHAFLNALNLANSVAPTGTPAPTGQAYTTVPGNANSVVPTLLLNTLGNVFQACVNSTGGVAGDTTACGKLFTAATPPSTSTASPVTPTNTLQAVLNLAKYPTLTPANVTALYGIATAQTFFTPALAAVPNDYSMAITYKGPTPATAFYGFFTVADISDTTYTFNETGNGSGPVSVAAMTSNGTNLYQGTTITGALCTAGSPCAAGVDSVGHLWLANTNSTNKNVYELKTADGSLVGSAFAIGSTTAPNSAAVDRFNNVFMTSANTTANNLYELTSGGSSFAAVVANSTAETQTANPPEYIGIDAAGSVWNTNFITSGTTQITWNQNTASAGVTPAFANAFVTTAASATLGSAEGISFDAAGNAWLNNTLALYKVTASATPTVTTITISGTGGNAGATNPQTATSARFNYQDGDGNIFMGDNSKNLIWQYLPGTGNFIYMIPCTGNSGTACITSGQRIAATRNVLTDSTGSIWVSNPSATIGNGNIAQIIGTAAPTWGQQSYGLPGVRP